MSLDNKSRERAKLKEMETARQSVWKESNPFTSLSPNTDLIEKHIMTLNFKVKLSIHQTDLIHLCY